MSYKNEATSYDVPIANYFLFLLNSRRKDIKTHIVLRFVYSIILTMSKSIMYLLVTLKSFCFTLKNMTSRRRIWPLAKVSSSARYSAKFKVTRE